MKKLDFTFIVLFLAFVFTLLLGRVAIYSPTLAFLFTLLLLTAGLLWIYRLHRSGISTTTTTLDLPLLIFSLALLLTSHFSMDPVRSFRLAWSWLACLSSFYIFLTFFRTRGTAAGYLSAASSALFFFVILGFIELLPQLTSGNFQIRAVNRLTGFTGSANILGIYLAIGALVQVDRIVKKDASFYWHAAWLLGAAPIFLLSRSRGGFLALAAGLAVFLVARRINIPAGSTPKRHLLLAGAAAVVVGVALFWGVTALRPDPVLGGTGGVRLTFWRTAVDNWLAHPLLGSGLDTFGTVNMLRNQPVLNSLFLRAAHSLWFTILSGTGLVGTAALLWLVGAAGRILWHTRHQWRANPLPLAIIAAMVVHSSLDTPEPWTLFLAGSLIATFPWPRPKQINALTFFPVVLWGVVVVVGMFAFSVTRHYSAGVALAEEGRWGEAARSFDHAAPMGPYRDSAALLGSGLAYATSGNQEMAISRFEALTTQEPGWPGTYVNLAALYHAVDRPQDALNALQTASKLAPHNDVVNINLTLAEGAKPGSRAAPDLHPFWTAATAGDWATAQKLRGELPDRQPLADGVLAVHAGHLDEAKLYFDDAIAFNQVFEADLWRLWVDFLQNDPSEIEAFTVETLSHRSLVGISPALTDVYQRIIFSRAGLPIDLVPNVWCPVSHPTVDPHLQILANYLAATGQPSDAAWLDSWRQGSHPTTPGLTPCNPNTP